MLAASGTPAQNVVLTDPQGLSVEIGTHGLVQLRVANESYRFIDLHPVVVRLTSLAGGQMTWSEYRGEELQNVQSQVSAVSGTQARVTWSRCRVPGIAGAFDLVYDYELVSAPHGPGVAIRGRLAASTLAVGIAGVAYRQYLMSTVEPDVVVGGFTGAACLAFDDLATGMLDLSHPYFATGGRLQLGTNGETFLTTRTGESLLVAATRHPNRKHGLLLTRDGRNDPDNVARELGFFGANDVAQGPRAELGLGVIGYLPNDDRPGNGGTPWPIGSGIVLGVHPQENADAPYWDVVRAYRSRWVDPMLVGLQKPNERPAWLARSQHMVLNVADAGVVRHEAVAQFIDDYLQFHDQVDELAVLLWGATGGEDYGPMPGLDQLVPKLAAIETRLGKRIRTAVYYQPTFYEAPMSGGSRLAEVCRDPFANPFRFPIPNGSWAFAVDVGSPANATFFTNWLSTTLPPLGIDGVYFDDAFRHRTFFTYHYDASVAEQGRTTAPVEGYMAQLQETGAHFAKTADGGYMTTELGWIGRKAPGNLIQGVAMLEPNGPFFGSADDLMRFQPWLNDVAGHHWLSGYAGSIAQSWLWLQDVDDLLYFATPIVRGLVPVHAPLALNNRYYDFFQLCSERIVDCTDPRFRAVGMHSSYENAGAAFFRRHNDVLTGWRRQPLPGTHDVQEHEIAFLDRQGTLAYKVAVDEIPYGCFSDGKRVAIALTNPRLSPRTASFRLERDRYGMSLDGSYRVTVQRLGDGLPVQVLEGATGDLAFAVTLESRDYAMVIVEPVPYSWSSTPNLAGCDGGKLAGSTGGAGGIHVTLTVSDALPQAPGIMVYGYGSSSLPLPVSSCHLLVDPNGSIQVPFGTDANGRATLRFQVGAITALMQAITVDFTTTPWASLHATNAVTLHFP